MKIYLTEKSNLTLVSNQQKQQRKQKMFQSFFLFFEFEVDKVKLGI